MYYIIGLGDDERSMMLTNLWLGVCTGLGFYNGSDYNSDYLSA